jgi:hypothetical protein
MFGRSFRKSQRSHRPSFHPTSTARFNRTQGRNLRQQSRRNSINRRSTNRTKGRKSFIGGFFEKFASEIKKMGN